MPLLRKFASWRLAGVLFILYCVFAFGVMPNLMSGGETSAPGSKLGPLDLLFSYSPQQAYLHIESYGDLRGKAAMLSLTFDTAYPIIYTSLFMVLIYLLVKQVWPMGRKVHLIALIPLFAFVFDLAENVNIVILLTSYPKQLDFIARMASTFTSLKWIFVGINIAIFLGLLFAVIFAKFRNEKSRL
ncbi:MAG: hypothetical protein COA91_06365 [Robiginitomaculum sp.]|nr:MAG: hypothetical protein COA91_06365 [Robiginitomaculum sp.]